MDVLDTIEVQMDDMKLVEYIQSAGVSENTREWNAVFIWYVPVMGLRKVISFQGDLMLNDRVELVMINLIRESLVCF